MPDSTAIPTTPDREPRYSYARAYCSTHGRAVFRAPAPLDPAVDGSCVHCTREPAQVLAAAAVPESEQTPRAPSPLEAASPADASVDGSGARVLPPGWSAMGGPPGAFLHQNAAQVRDQLTRGWFWISGDEEHQGTAPTMLRAMCAALGIDVVPATCVDRRNAFTALHASRTMDVSGPTADDCARAALERFHAAQQPTNGLGALFGKCPGGETEGEILAALKNDHEPSRCDTCAANGVTQRDARGRLLGAPELSAMERGTQPASASVAPSNADAASDIYTHANALYVVAQALRRGKDREQLGVELLRISNALATLSVQVRGRG
jgi:hypothetical protein